MLESIQEDIATSSMSALTVTVATLWAENMQILTGQVHQFTWKKYCHHTTTSFGGKYDEVA
jgi:hypothetical protein